MKVDCLVAEIGSTTTIVNAFNLHKEVAFLGRGMYQTTVDSDVRIGLKNAIDDLKKNLDVKDLSYGEMLASSSAAGGLKITVHGLVYEMTAKAAKEAALNAGGNIHLVTANRLEPSHIREIKSIKPNMIIIAGGTDFGEKEIPYQNLIDVKDLGIPIIYTGNITNHERIKALNIPNLSIVENVYPRVDDFNIIPLREKIYETFEKHIIHAKGMSHIFEMVKDVIIPTPGAVMESTLLLNELFGGVVTIDVGGATTDVHSVSEPRPEYLKYHDGEPNFKRTVEGDLGVFINRMSVYQTFKYPSLEHILSISKEKLDDLIREEPFIPQSNLGKKMVDELTKQCVYQALNRHIGDMKRVFTTNGYKVIPEGKDLSLVKAFFLTGGALLNHQDPESIIRSYLKKEKTKLIPDEKTIVYKDHDYIFASIGVLSRKYKEQAEILLKKTLRMEVK
ncbi:MAG: DNA mismatch repair protein MutL [Tenericutes bacterium HGW-Tenericutes-6]|nr:MAG: DNA mismatch repair protein MutL [Tenericutes bacterium HGW-Tenericutes-6]